MDDFPKCQVCQQQFKLKGPPPYLLPCLHAVCETCVTSTAGGGISCSTCQREVNLTETHLQKDVVRQREIFHLTFQHRPSELLCTHEDDGNQAVCWCQECEEFLCEHCQNMHESFKATRRHAVQEIAEIQPGSLDHDEYCCTHTNCPLDYWDQECNILICGRCRRGDHADHEVVDIDVAAGGARAEFVAREQEVRQVGVHHNSLLDTTREQLKSSSETHNTLSDKISHTFRSMKALLDQREKELLIALQRHTEVTKSHLESKTNKSQFSRSRGKMTSEYIQKALLYSSKYDFLKIKKTIGETTQSCIDSAPSGEQEDLPLPVFSTEGLDRLQSSLSSFGEIKTVKDVFSQNQMFQDKATQAGAEYFAKLEEMENRHKMGSSKPDFVEESENHDRTDESTGRPGETLTASVVDESFIDHKMEFIFVGPRPKINAESRCILTRPDILHDTMSCYIEPATMTGDPDNDSKYVHHREQDGTEGRRNIMSDLGSNGPGCGQGGYGSATSGSMSMGKSMTPEIGDKACRVSVPKGTSGQDIDKDPVASDRTSVSITGIAKYPPEDNRDETCIGSVAKGTHGAVLTAAPRGKESTSFDTTSIGKSLRAEIGDETFIDRKMEVIPVEPFQKINKESMRIQTSFELPVGASPFTAVINPVKLSEDDSGAGNGQDLDFDSNGPGCGPGGYGSTSGSMSMGKSMTPEIGDKACRVSVPKGTSGQDIDKDPVASDKTSVSITGIAKYPPEDNRDETCIGSVAKGTHGAVLTAAPRGKESTSFDTTSIGKSLRAEIGDETFIDRKMEVIPVEPFQKINKESMRIQTSFELPVGASPFTAVINPVKLSEDDSGAGNGQDLDFDSNGPGCGPGGYGSTSGSMSMGKSMTPEIGDKACRVSVPKGTSGQDIDKDPVASDKTSVSITGIAKYPPEDNRDETCIGSVAKGTHGAVLTAAPRGKESTSFDTTSIGKSLRAEIGDETFIDRKMEVIPVEPFQKINKESMRIQTSFELPVGASPFTAVINPVKLSEDDSGAGNGQDLDFDSNGPGCGPGGYGSTSGSMSMGKSMTPEIGDKACRVSVPKGTSGQDIDKDPVASDKTSVSITGIAKYPPEDNRDETCIGSVAKGTHGAVLTAAPRGKESTSFDTTSIGKSLRAEIGDETFIDRKMEVIPVEPFQKINKESMRIQTSFELPVGASPFTAVINPVKLSEDDSGAGNGQDLDFDSNGPGCGPGGYGSTSGSMSMGKSMTPEIGDKACRVSVPKGTSGQDIDKDPVASDKTSVSITGIAKYPPEDNRDETCIGSVAKGTHGAVLTAAPRGKESTSVDTTSIGKSLRAEIGDETFIDRKMEVIPVEPFQKINKESMRIQTSFELPVGASPFTAVINPVKLSEDDSGAGNGQDLDFDSNGTGCGPGGYGSTSGSMSMGKSMIPEIGDKACRVYVPKGTSGQDIDKDPVASDKTSVSITGIAKYPPEDNRDETCIGSVAKGTHGAVLTAAPRGKESTSFDTTSIGKSLRAEIGDETFIDRKMEVIPVEPFQKINKESMRIQTSFELPVGASPFTAVINPVKLSEDDSGAGNGQDLDFDSNGTGCGPGGYGSTSGSMSMGKSMIPEIGDKACRVYVPKGTSGQDIDKDPVASDKTSVSITGIAKYPPEDNRDETCIGSVAKGTHGAVLTAAPRGKESTSFDTTSIGKSLRAEIGDETFIDRKMEVIPVEPFQKINKESMRIQTSFELPVGASPFTAVINPVKLSEDDSGAGNGQDLDFDSNGPGLGPGGYGSTSGSMSMGKSMTPEIGDKACRVSVPKGTSGQDIDKDPVASDKTSVSITGIAKYPPEDNRDETCIGSVAKGTHGAVLTAAPRGKESTSFDTTSIGKSLRAEIGDETFIDRKMEVIPVEPFQKINKESMRIQTSFELPVGASPFTAVIDPVKLSEDDSGARIGQDIDFEHKVPVAGSYSQDHDRTGLGRSLTAEIGDETYIDRKMEFIHVDNFKKVKVPSSTICYDS